MRYVGGGYNQYDNDDENERPLPGAGRRQTDGYVKSYEADDPAFKEYVKSIGAFGNQSPSKKPASQPRNRKGFVYLLAAFHDKQLYKIGRATNPNNRLRTFNVKLPFPVAYECVIETGDMYRLERELHRLFDDKRLDGEWFRLSQSDVQYIKSLGATK